MHNMKEMLMENEDQRYEEANKIMDDSNIDMITCTPMLHGRKLVNMPPPSPFLSSAQMNRDSTPILKAVHMKGNGDSVQI